MQAQSIPSSLLLTVDAGGKGTVAAGSWSAGRQAAHHTRTEVRMQMRPAMYTTERRPPLDMSMSAPPCARGGCGESGGRPA